MYQIAIADDHPLFCTALTEVILKFYPDAEITSCNDLESSLKALNNGKDFDLLLLDLHMPGSHGMFGLISIREKFPSVPVAIVSASNEQETINRAIGLGAVGYLVKSLDTEQMREAVDTILDGQQWVPEAYRNHLQPISEEDQTLAARLAELTPQQYRVLCYLREGWLNKQIAYELSVTEATVKAHITSIFRKLGVSNRTQAVIELNKMAIQDTTAPAAQAHKHSRM
jgi:DNA-binding NarL/FixJ family response regulator